MNINRLIPKFQGSIGISAVDDDIYHVDFDLDDYICHQFDYCDVVVNVPIGFNIIRLNDDLSVPKSVIRDIKIDGII